MNLLKIKGPISARFLLPICFLAIAILAGCSTAGRAPSSGKPSGESGAKGRPSESASIEWGEAGSGAESKGGAADSGKEGSGGAKIAGTAGEDGQAYLNGAGLAELKCTLCHDSARWKGQERDRNWWNAKVDKMMRLGASKWITAEQAREIVDYLAVESAAEASEQAADGKAKQIAGENKPVATAVAQETEVAGTAAATSAAEDTGGAAAASVPERQAYTGAEVWLYILGGGSMLAAGLRMRGK